MNQQALHDYANAGGRVFASHFHYSWFNSGPYAQREPRDLDARRQRHRRHHGNDRHDAAERAAVPQGPGAARSGSSNVGALQNGTLPIERGAPQRRRRAPTHTPSQPWIVADQNSRGAGRDAVLLVQHADRGRDAPDGDASAAASCSAICTWARRPATIRRSRCPHGCADGACCRRRRRRSSSCSSTCRRASRRTKAAAAAAGRVRRAWYEAPRSDLGDAGCARRLHGNGRRPARAR